MDIKPSRWRQIIYCFSFAEHYHLGVKTSVKLATKVSCSSTFAILSFLWIVWDRKQTWNCVPPTDWTKYNASDVFGNVGTLSKMEKGLVNVWDLFMAKLVLQPSCHFQSLESLFSQLSSEVLYENLRCVVPKICPQKQVDVFLSSFLACRGMRKFRIVDFSQPPHAKG